MRQDICVSLRATRSSRKRWYMVAGNILLTILKNLILTQFQPSKGYLSKRSEAEGRSELSESTFGGEKFRTIKHF